MHLWVYAEQSSTNYKQIQFHIKISINIHVCQCVHVYICVYMVVYRYNTSVITPLPSCFARTKKWPPPPQCHNEIAAGKIWFQLLCSLLSWSAGIKLLSKITQNYFKRTGFLSLWMWIGVVSFRSVPLNTDLGNCILLNNFVLAREATEIDLHQNNMNRKSGLFPNRY
jgi:hypothetical protein